MAPNSNALQKVNVGMKRSSYRDGDQETSCKKRCYHPTHDGVTRYSKSKLRIRTPEPKDHFPVSQNTMKAAVAIFQENREELQEALQEGGAGMRKKGCNCTLLQFAIRFDFPEMAKVLLETVDPNAVNRYSQTAAHIAAVRGHTKVLKFLLAHESFNPNKMDVWNKTYKDNLAAPLFTAVLWSDEKLMLELLELGADPDGHAGLLVEGVMTRELKVTTPRELAIALSNTSIVNRFSKPVLANEVENFNINSPILEPNKEAKSLSKGFVNIFTYGSFKGRQDLTNEASSEDDANNLAKVFSEMGYTGDMYSSLSAEDTLEALRNVREMEMLGDNEVAIFYFSSYVAIEDSPEDSFLTSDMRHLTISSVLNLFRESKCPHYLKDKPKIFIFDLCKTPKDELNVQDLKYPEGVAKGDMSPHSTRSQGLQQTICLFSSIKKDFRPEGSAFNKALCDILSCQGQKIWMNELFEKLKQKMTNEGIANKSYLFDSSNKWDFHFTV